MTGVPDFLLSGVVGPPCERGLHPACPGRAVSRFNGRRHITVCVCECHDRMPARRAESAPRPAPKPAREPRKAPTPERSMAARLAAARRYNRDGKYQVLIAQLEDELAALRRRKAG